jgi:hypothetical protein
VNDSDVKLGWRVLRAIPVDDESDAAYRARDAVHSLVWTTWQLRDEVAALRTQLQEARA